MDRRDPLISPLFADLTGFPPILIQVGSAETLLADATRLAEAAGEADVEVTLEIWPHMIHAWPVWNAKPPRWPPRAGLCRPVHPGAYPLAPGAILQPQNPDLAGFCPKSRACPANPGF